MRTIGREPEDEPSTSKDDVVPFTLEAPVIGLKLELYDLMFPVSKLSSRAENIKNTLEH